MVKRKKLCCLISLIIILLIIGGIMSDWHVKYYWGYNTICIKNIEFIQGQYRMPIPDKTGKPRQCNY
jgi:hypothetical protein